MLFPPVIVIFQNYEVVGFQPHPVDTPDLGYVHTPSSFSSPPTLNIHASDKTRQTKNRQWAHLFATSVGIFPGSLESILSYSTCQISIKFIYGPQISLFYPKI